MQIRFIDNQREKVGDALVSELESAQVTRIAVAFVSASGLNAIESAILSNLTAGGKAEILVGLDFATTEPTALQKMFDWMTDFEGFQYFVLPPSGSFTYHPKMYIFSEPTAGVTIVGSSNLTDAGLFRNAEANVLIRSMQTDEVFDDALASFLRLKFDNRRIPDEELILKYTEAANRIEKASKVFSAKQLKSLQAPVEEKANSLPRPMFTPDDLAGWLKLVYEALPEGEFSNDEIYAREEEFQDRYPDNQNIRQKIRQQLQYLRDKGLVEHRSRGTWRKI